MAHIPTIPLPRQWPHYIKSGLLHAVSMASAAFTTTCSLAAARKTRLVRLKAELAQAHQEIAFLKEEIDIKDERFQRISPHRRKMRFKS